MLTLAARESRQTNPAVGLSVRSDLTGLSESLAAEVVQSDGTLTLYSSVVNIHTTSSKILKFYPPPPPPPTHTHTHTHTQCISMTFISLGINGDSFPTQH